MGQSISIASVIALAIAARAQNRLLVPSQYPDLAAAVAAAQDGDTIELAGGVQSTGGASVDRTLDIVGAGTTLTGDLTFAVPAGKALSMTGCRLGYSAGSYPLVFLAPADLQIHSAGRVAISDGLVGYGEITITDSLQVLIRNTGLNDNVLWEPYAPLQVRNSTVVLDHCTFFGYHSLDSAYPGSLAVSVADSDVRCSNSVIHGGDGQVWFGVPIGGGGGIAAVRSRLLLAENVIVAPGPVGTAPSLALDGGVAILDPLLNPTILTTNGAVVSRAATPIVVATGMTAGSSAGLTLHSPPDTLGALLLSFPADRTVVPGVFGELWLDASRMCIPRLGVQNGAFTWTTSVPALWPFPAEFRWQGLVLDNGTLTLTDPGAALLH